MLVFPMFETINSYCRIGTLGAGKSKHHAWVRNGLFPHWLLCQKTGVGTSVREEDERTHQPTTSAIQHRRSTEMLSWLLLTRARRADEWLRAERGAGRSASSSASQRRLLSRHEGQGHVGCLAGRALPRFGHARNESGWQRDFDNGEWTFVAARTISRPTAAPPAVEAGMSPNGQNWTIIRGADGDGEVDGVRDRQLVPCVPVPDDNTSVRRPRTAA